MARIITEWPILSPILPQASRKTAETTSGGAVKNSSLKGYVRNITLIAAHIKTILLDRTEGNK